MKHSDFVMGQHFTCYADATWRVTDIGTRTVIAIRVRDDILAEGWDKGPPYAVCEIVFDENDFPACEPLP